ncbi:MAG: hypothetical protein ABR582_11390, partial [Gemmatimonadaceae bacterium]
MTAPTTNPTGESHLPMKFRFLLCAAVVACGGRSDSASRDSVAPAAPIAPTLGASSDVSGC